MKARVTDLKAGDHFYMAGCAGLLLCVAVLPTKKTFRLVRKMNYYFEVGSNSKKFVNIITDEPTNDGHRQYGAIDTEVHEKISGLHVSQSAVREVCLVPYLQHRQLCGVCVYGEIHQLTALRASYPN